MFARMLLIVAACLLAGACSPVALLNASVPTEGLSITRDIAYGAQPRQTLDLYLPAQPKDAPLIVFFYGGSWQMGDKKDYLFVAQALAARGYAVAIPDYRVYPQVKYPTFLEDGAQALVWLHAHGAQYGLNSQRMTLMGHSAGAYNAAMLTLNPSYLKQAGGKTEWIAAFIGLAGPYDFLPLTDPKLIDIFSPEADGPLTQPITYAHKDAPRTLLLTGRDDRTVYPRNSRLLALRLASLGVDVTFREYPGVGHVGIALGLADSVHWNDQVMNDVAAFLAR